MPNGHNNGSLRPQSQMDWAKLVMTVIIGVLMLLVGRTWGENNQLELIQQNARQADLAFAAAQALTDRFEDYVQSAAATDREILQQIREVRGLLEARR